MPPAPQALSRARAPQQHGGATKGEGSPGFAAPEDGTGGEELLPQGAWQRDVHTERVPVLTVTGS